MLSTFPIGNSEVWKPAFSMSRQREVGYGPAATGSEVLHDAASRRAFPCPKLVAVAGVRQVMSDGAMNYGESLADLARALEGYPVDVVLTMCSTPENISVGRPIIQEAFDGPVGAYANLSYNPAAPWQTSRRSRTGSPARARTSYRIPSTIPPG